jgi:GT2 family glycosyltransferase
MSLIGMAVYSTTENQKDDCLHKTLNSLHDTVDFSKHRLILSVNGYTGRTQDIFKYHRHIISEVIYNSQNIGTAKAINKAWAFRKPGEPAVKMDDDIVIHSNGWIDEMESAITGDPLIGQVGLKRKDLIEWPGHSDPDYKSSLHMLPHIPGHPWQIVEKVKHCIGSCVMHSSDLLDKVGYLYQPSLYGYDDVIMSHRTHLAGFYSCFLPHINIDHIDEGKTPFQGWKEKHSGEVTETMIELVTEMYAGTKPIYYDSCN